jgi:hypothetical protein
MSLEDIDCFALVIRLASTGGILSTAQMLWERDEFRSGVHSWRNTELALIADDRWSAAPRLATDHRLVVAVLIVQLLTHGWLLAFPRTGALWLCAITIYFAGVFLRWRLPLDRDGGSQLPYLIAFVVLFGALSGPAAERWSLVFLSAVVSVIYFLSGIGKLVFRGWRTGDYLYDSLNLTVQADNRWITSRLHNGKFLRGALAWSLLIFEIAFPLAPFLGVPWVGAFLIAGTLFHVGLVVTLAHNTFFFPFLATYPAVLGTAVMLERAGYVIFH